MPPLFPPTDPLPESFVPTPHRSVAGLTRLLTIGRHASAFCACVGITLLLCSTSFSADATKPNVILIFVDDLGWGDVGVFHQNARREANDPSKPWFVTPNIDQLANEGARLTNHYVGAPVCVSSRSSLLQGVTQGHANVRDDQFDKAMDANLTMADVLHEAGYATAIVGKWGIHGREFAPSEAPSHPLHRGFDHFYGYLRHIDGHEHYPKEAPYFHQKSSKAGPVMVWDDRTEVTSALDKCYTTDLFTARAKYWLIRQHDQSPGHPFFLYLAYDTPHAVLELPTGPYPSGGGRDGGIQWLNSPGKMINTAHGPIDSWVHPDYATQVYDHDANPATTQIPWPDVYQRYATSVRRIDDAVGDIIQLLHDLAIDENTLVIFASDNGPSIESYLTEPFTPEFFGGFGPFDGIKRDCLEGGLRTPAIARWPAQILPGRVIDAPTATWDWLPTLARVAGLPIPARADGVSLLPLLTGTGRMESRDHLYFEYNGADRTPEFSLFEAKHRNRIRGQMQAIRQGDLMAVRYDIQSAEDDFEIYNITHDPKQSRDLAHEPQSRDMQIKFKAIALQSRRTDPDAPRPYDDALIPATNPGPDETRAGVNWTSYSGEFPWVPALKAEIPLRSGSHATPDPAAILRPTESAICFTGYLRVPSDGTYTLGMRTDTGAVLRLHDLTAIDADHDYRPGSLRTTDLRLKAGFHPFTLLYRSTRSDHPFLTLEWSTPTGIPNPIQANVFAR